MLNTALLTTVVTTGGADAEPALVDVRPAAFTNCVPSRRSSPTRNCKLIDPVPLACKSPIAQVSCPPVSVVAAGVAPTSVTFCGSVSTIVTPVASIDPVFSKPIV